MPYPGWTLAIGGFLAIASFIPIGFVACSRRFGFSSPHANYEAGSPLKRIDTNASNNPMIHVSPRHYAPKTFKIQWWPKNVKRLC